MSVLRHEHSLGGVPNENMLIKRQQLSRESSFSGACAFSFPLRFAGINAELERLDKFQRLELFDRYCADFGDFLNFNIFFEKHRYVFRVNAHYGRVFTGEKVLYCLFCNMGTNKVQLQDGHEMHPGEGVVMANIKNASKSFNLFKSKEDILLIESYF